MAPEVVLRLDAYRDERHWRWRLLGQNQQYLASHDVEIDAGDLLYAGFTGLPAWLRETGPVGKSPEERAVKLGEWIATKVLGDVATKLAALRGPHVVRVEVEEAARWLVYCPLELATVRGKALALQGISLVYDFGAARSENASERPPVRVLAVFSLAEDGLPLALRRERYDLRMLAEELRQDLGLALELRVLHYGTTRKTLERALQDGAGWDVVHFSGHGTAGRLVLQKEDGTSAPIRADDLLRWLSPTRARLKLAVLSACESAAGSAATSALPVDGAVREFEAARPTTAAPAGTGPGLAQRVAVELDCAVLAMRYLIRDDLAIALLNAVYRQLLESGNPLTTSLQLSLDSMEREGHLRLPSDAATPVLLGASAASVQLRAPPGSAPGPFALSRQVIAPRESKRFVGRDGVLARAVTALAPRAGQRGVVFVGVPLAGKTACAMELIYGYAAGRFAGGIVWYKPPSKREDIAGSLARLALAMEDCLEGFHWTPFMDDREKFARFSAHPSSLMV